MSHTVGPLALALIHFIADGPDWKRWRPLSCFVLAHTHALSPRDNRHTGWVVSLSVSLSNSGLLDGSHAQSNSKLPFITRNTSLLVISLAHTHYPYKTRDTHKRSFPVSITLSFLCAHKHTTFALVCNKCFFYSPLIKRDAQTNCYF